MASLPSLKDAEVASLPPLKNVEAADDIVPSGNNEDDEDADSDATMVGEDDEEEMVEKEQEGNWEREEKRKAEKEKEEGEMNEKQRANARRKAAKEEAEKGKKEEEERIRKCMSYQHDENWSKRTPAEIHPNDEISVVVSSDEETQLQDELDELAALPLFMEEKGKSARERQEENAIEFRPPIQTTEEVLAMSLEERLRVHREIRVGDDVECRALHEKWKQEGLPLQLAENWRSSSISTAFPELLVLTKKVVAKHQRNKKIWMRGGGADREQLATMAEEAMKMGGIVLYREMSEEAIRRVLKRCEFGGEATVGAISDNWRKRKDWQDFEMQSDSSSFERIEKESVNTAFRDGESLRESAKTRQREEKERRDAQDLVKKRIREAKEATRAGE